MLPASAHYHEVAVDMACLHTPLEEAVDYA